MPFSPWLEIALGCVYLAVNVFGWLSAARSELARFGVPAHLAAAPRSLVGLRWLGLFLFQAGLMTNVLGAPRPVSSWAFVLAGAIGSILIVAVAMWERRLKRNWQAAQ